MAGKLRYWKEKDGRFWARISVPERLQPYLDQPRCELSEPLGGDRRTALRLHPAAVARLQHAIAVAQSRADAAATDFKASISPRPAITLADFGHAVWQRYSAALEADDAARASYPRADEIEAEREKLTRKAAAGEIGNEPSDILDASLDFLLLRDAQNCDRFTREARLAALQRELAAGQTHQVEHEIDTYLAERGLSAKSGSAERNVLAKQVMRAEIEALKRTLERDAGDYSGQPADPIVKPPAQAIAVKPVSLSQLWIDYRRSC